MISGELRFLNSFPNSFKFAKKISPTLTKPNISLRYLTQMTGLSSSAAAVRQVSHSQHAKHFHGFQYKDYERLFGDLSVNRAVRRGEVKHGQYIVLRLGFSLVWEGGTQEESKRSLYHYINQVLIQLVRTLEHHNPQLHPDVLLQCNFGDTEDAVHDVMCVVRGIHDALNRSPREDKFFWCTRGLLLCSPGCLHNTNDWQVHITIDDYDASALCFLFESNARKEPWGQSVLAAAYGSSFRAITSMRSLKCDIKMVFMAGITLSRDPEWKRIQHYV